MAEPTNSTSLLPNSAIKIMQLRQKKDENGVPSMECDIIKANVSFVRDQLKESGAELVSIIAVMGSYRTGKSFLLDLLLRRLRHMSAEEARLEAEREATGGTTLEYHKEKADVDNNWEKVEVDDAGEEKVLGEVPVVPEDPWHFEDGKKHPLPNWLLEGDSNKVSEGAPGGGREADGFVWRPGQEKCTEGIWLWSSPFVFRDAEGRKVGVLLMDTQGAFDDTITKAQSSTIFGMTALLSSTLIYNMQNNVQEIILDNLDYITTYAQTACCEIDNNHAPFGRLEFLVRDWPNYEDGFSLEACRDQMADHLDSHLNPERVCADACPRVERLKGSFRSIGCSGLPHPGIQVTKPKYGGEIDKIDPDFFKLLDDFTGRLFGENFPEASAPIGNEITVDSFVRIISTFADTFQDKKEMATNLRDGFVKVEMMSAKEELLKKFNTKMSRLAPESSVVDPAFLSDETCKILQEIDHDFKMKLKPWKLTDSEEMEVTDALFETMKKAVEVRTLQNTKEVEGATVKLVASPVVGGAAYFLFCHHFILVFVGGAGAVAHLKKWQKKESSKRGCQVSLADSKVFEGVAVDVKQWGEQRWRDVQAISIATKRFSADDAMAQLTNATNEARAMALRAAAGGAATSARTLPLGGAADGPSPTTYGSTAGGPPTATYAA